MGIFLIIVIIVIVCWPWISRWLKTFLAHRTEDYLRKATGMPPRPGSREDRRRQRASRQACGSQGDQPASSSYSSYSSGPSSSYSRRSRQRSRTRRGYDEPIIPPEYAEDVEFVEVKSFSETVIGSPAGNTRQFHESQVSDAEWVEVREKR